MGAAAMEENQKICKKCNKVWTVSVKNRAKKYICPICAHKARKERSK